MTTEQANQLQSIYDNIGYVKIEVPVSITSVSGSANLQCGATDSTVTQPTFKINCTDFNSITVKLSNSTNSYQGVTFTTDSGISVKLPVGTEKSYDISSATYVQFKSYYNISTYGNFNISYTLLV